MNTIKEIKLTAGSIFCGIGGFCSGFREFGIDTIWAIDIDQRVGQSYEKNYGKNRFIQSDVRAVKDSIASEQKLEPVDILHAGFPCQSFSMAGNRNGFNDSRGQLFFELIRIIKEFREDKPAALVFENSPYLKIGERGEWFNKVKFAIQEAGYWFKESNALTLDPQEHLGLPQYRPRLFMIALNRERFRNGRIDFSIEPPKERKLLSDIINFKGEVDDGYYLDIENRYYSMISSKRSDEEEVLYQLRKFRVRTKNHCPTLTANMGLGGHNVPFLFDRRGLRKLTEAECLKLQGFNKFIFPDEQTSASKYLQIGNSVHVDVAKLIAQTLIKKFKGLL